MIHCVVNSSLELLFFKDIAYPHHRKGMPFDIFIGGILDYLFSICFTFTWDHFSSCLCAAPCSEWLVDSMDSLALRLPFGFHLWKTLVGKQRAGWERGVDTYSMSSVFSSGTGRKKWYYMWLYFTPTCRILQFSMFNFMNSGEKQFTFGSSFELQNSL